MSAATSLDPGSDGTAAVAGGSRAPVLPRLSPLQVDGLVVAALAVLGSVSGAVLVAPTVTGRAAPSTPVIVLWALALAAPLLLRRRFPCTVLVVTVLHFPFYWALGQLHEIACWLVLGVAVYSAAAYGPRPRAAWCAGTALVASTLLFSVSALVAGVAPASVAVFGMENALPYVLGWTLGHATRRLREYRSRSRSATTSWPAAAPPRRDGPSWRSGCGLPASCTTSSPTTCPSSASRPASRHGCSPNGPTPPAKPSPTSRPAAAR